jgi:hypothetical protein
VNRCALGVWPVRMFISLCKTRLLTIAPSAADLLRGQGGAIVVLGEAGSGKIALLAGPVNGLLLA